LQKQIETTGYELNVKAKIKEQMEAGRRHKGFSKDKGSR
jgi:hypothetical protein